MGKYDSNPIIEGRYDAYGRKTYWNEGYTGKGVKVAIIDEFSIEHGNQMASNKEKIASDCELIKLEMGKNSYSAIVDRIKDAIKLGVNIISISRSVDFDTTKMQNAIKECKNAGIMVFCSAGNDGDLYLDNVNIKKYPAYYEETISVMSIDNTFNFSSFASHNDRADICGFGQNVLVKNSDGQELMVSGTSPTTAACAFTAALHWCKILKDTGKHPTWDYMMDFVKTNVVDLNASGKDNFTGYGFFTLDKSEFERIRMMILDSDKNGLTDRVDRIHALMNTGMSYEAAEAKISKEYFIVSYEVIEGILVPVYGGRKPY